MKNRSILNTARRAIGAALAMIVAEAAVAAPAASTGAVPAHAAPAGTVADVGGGTANQDASGNTLAQSRNAARSRMRECGHQWSSMKKNGSAAGMTWKDFSQGCLAKQ